MKALLPAWLPGARRRLRLTPATEAALRQITARQMDRRLPAYKRQRGTRIYGRTKPGTLLKQHIPIRTERWDAAAAGLYRNRLSVAIPVIAPTANSSIR